MPVYVIRKRKGGKQEKSNVCNLNVSFTQGSLINQIFQFDNVVTPTNVANVANVAI